MVHQLGSIVRHESTNTLLPPRYLRGNRFQSEHGVSTFFWLGPLRLLFPSLEDRASLTMNAVESSGNGDEKTATIVRGPPRKEISLRSSVGGSQAVQGRGISVHDFLALRLNVVSDKACDPPPLGPRALSTHGGSWSVVTVSSSTPSLYGARRQLGVPRGTK